MKIVMEHNLSLRIRSSLRRIDVLRFASQKTKVRLRLRLRLHWLIQSYLIDNQQARLYICSTFT